MRRSTLLLAAVAIALARPPALHADVADSVAADISQWHYTHYLNDVLYTHDGDDRGFGPEHDLARDAIYDQFAGYGLQTSLDPFTYSGSTYYNVVATIPGRVRPGDIYVIGAHYDSVNNPGADDNASGVAGVLEMARVAAEYWWDATIVFIAFDREEQGLIGSQAWVDEHLDDNIVGMVTMDMIAWNPERQRHDWVRVYAGSDYWVHRLQVANAIEACSSLVSLPCKDLRASDHVPFEDAGFPGALVIEETHATNPHYHQPEDSVDSPDYIDYHFATEVTRGVAGWAALYGGATETAEPGTLLLVVAGAACLAWRRRRAA